MGNSTNSLIRMLELTDALKIFQGPKVKGLTLELWQYFKKKNHQETHSASGLNSFERDLSPKQTLSSAILLTPFFKQERKAELPAYYYPTHKWRRPGQSSGSLPRVAAKPGSVSGCRNWLMIEPWFTVTGPSLVTLLSLYSSYTGPLRH